MSNTTITVGTQTWTFNDPSNPSLIGNNSAINNLMIIELFQAIATTLGVDGPGTVTNIATGTGLTGGPITGTGTITIGTSGVTAGTFGDSTHIPQLVVNALGQITHGSGIAITYGTGSVTSLVSGTDFTGGTITNTGTINLGTTGVTAGTYTLGTVTSIAVDAKGRITNIT